MQASASCCSNTPRSRRSIDDAPRPPRLAIRRSSKSRSAPSTTTSVGRSTVRAPSGSGECCRWSGSTPPSTMARSWAVRERFRRAQHSGRAAALCRRDGRRRPADTSPPRNPRSDDAGAARRRSRARGAGRRALGLGGDDLRTLRLRPRQPGRDDPGLSGPRRIATRPARTEWDDPPRRPRRGCADLPAYLRPRPATVPGLRLAKPTWWDCASSTTDPSAGAGVVS